MAAEESAGSADDGSSRGLGRVSPQFRPACVRQALVCASAPLGHGDHHICRCPPDIGIDVAVMERQFRKRRRADREYFSQFNRNLRLLGSLTADDRQFPYHAEFAQQCRSKPLLRSVFVEVEAEALRKRLWLKDRRVGVWRAFLNDCVEGGICPRSDLPDRVTRIEHQESLEMWGDFFVRREWQLCIDLALDAMQEALDGNVHNKVKAKKKKKKKAKDKKKKKKKKEKGEEEEANAVWDLTELARGGAAMKLPVDGGGDGGSIARKRTASAAAAASSPGSSSGSDRGDLDGRPAPKRVKAAPVQTLVFGGAVGAGGGYIPKVAAPGPQEVMSKLTFAVNNMNNIKQLADSGMLSASEYKALMADAKRVMIRAQKEYTIVSTGGGHADADTVSSSELS